MGRARALLLGAVLLACGCRAPRYEGEQHERNLVVETLFRFVGNVLSYQYGDGLDQDGVFIEGTR